MTKQEYEKYSAGPWKTIFGRQGISMVNKFGIVKGKRCILRPKEFKKLKNLAYQIFEFGKGHTIHSRLLVLKFFGSDQYLVSQKTAFEVATFDQELKKIKTRGKNKPKKSKSPRVETGARCHRCGAVVLKRHYYCPKGTDCYTERLNDLTAYKGGAVPSGALSSGMA